MWLHLKVVALAFIPTFVLSSCTSAVSLSGSCSISSLKPLLSQNASISYNASTDPRWSEYNAPTPGAIVNVATERDVVATVRYCNAKGIPFLAQNGGHGWISSFDLHSNGVIINMHGLNKVTFNSARTKATIGGGTLVAEAIEAAYANNAQLTTGNCNCIGTLGAILGGGYGNLMGLNGFGVDTLLSLNYVNPDGDLVTVTPNNTDLWWALRGAGPNFGIVTHAVVQSTYIAQADNIAWHGSIVFTGDKLESIISAINDLKLEPEMNVFMYFIISNSEPVILLTPFYNGDESTARQKFATILAIGPTTDTTAVTPYNQWNDGAAGFCVKGERKPSYAAGMLHMNPTTWRTVWNEFVNFTSNPGTESSIVLMEAYSLGKGQSVLDSSSSFPNRHVSFNAAAIPWYSDVSLDPIAEGYGKKVRDIWWANSGLASNTSYINFAHGDEELDIVYGPSLQRLQALKKRYDPRNVFNQWFPLLPRSQVASV